MTRWLILLHLVFGLLMANLAEAIDCIDIDGDGYGVGVGCTGPDVDDSASSCTTDAATDTDSDGVMDCLDLCGDVDEDNYGSDWTTNVVGIGADQVGNCTTDGSTSCSHGDSVCIDLDCNDSDSNEYPGQTWYPDCDGDSFTVGTYEIACSLTEANQTFYCVDTQSPDGGWHNVLGPEDCDDEDPNRFPGASEIPGDGIDQDCDIHDACYFDSDADGFGSVIVVSDLDDDGCNAFSNESTVNTDCLDSDQTVFPGALDSPGDNVDDNCSGFVVCYDDADSDGFGTTTSAESSFTATGGVSDISSACGSSGSDVWDDSSDDCEDSNGTIYPGASEVCGDGVDANCDDIGGPLGDEDDDGCSWTEEDVAGTSDCDDDSDNDFLDDFTEMGGNCVYDAGETDPNDQDTDDDDLKDGIEDADLDGVKDADESDPLDPDTDDDGWCDDNRFDNDGDGIDPIDSCDGSEKDNGTSPILADTDSDTNPDPLDNCPVDYNPEQLDANNDGIGDVCDPKNMCFDSNTELQGENYTGFVYCAASDSIVAGGVDPGFVPIDGQGFGVLIGETGRVVFSAPIIELVPPFGVATGGIFFAGPSLAPLCDLTGFSAIVQTVQQDSESILYYALSSASEPYDALVIELFAPVSIGTFSLTGENYVDCVQCVTVFTGCTASLGCEKTFLASDGTLNVSSIDTLFQGSMERLELQEVTIDPGTNVSTPVPDGSTYCISNWDFSAPNSP